MSESRRAFFQPAEGGGHRLYIYHPAQGSTPRGAVLYVHPWAEEMNKSRRMAALTSRALAAHGWAVLQIDLSGCGDSSGDFGHATWDAWVSDVVAGAAWMRAHHPSQALWFWGLRVGALLACAAAERFANPVSLLFWQPTLDGKSAWRQFLRLKAAAHLDQGGGGKAVLDAAQADLADGRSVEIAGYTVAPALARGLASATLCMPRPAGAGSSSRRLVCLEIAARSSASPAAAALAQWQTAGWRTSLATVPGPAFWQTAEIEDAPQLLDATVEALAA